MQATRLESIVTDDEFDGMYARKKREACLSPPSCRSEAAGSTMARGNSGNLNLLVGLKTCFPGNFTESTPKFFDDVR